MHWHDPEDGSDGAGHGGDGGISAHISGSAKYSADGSHVDIQIGGNSYGDNGQTHAMKTHGAVIYSSQWQGWVPGDWCGNSGDLGSSVYTVKNLKITGKVVQGPEPKRCNPLPPAPTPPPPSPWPHPTPIAPSPPLPPPTPVPPSPSGDCPGGSLSACIGMCPDDPKLFQICTSVCTQRCAGGGSCTGGDDGSDLSTCVGNCPTDESKFKI